MDNVMVQYGGLLQNFFEDHCRKYASCLQSPSFPQNPMTVLDMPPEFWVVWMIAAVPYVVHTISIETDSFFYKSFINYHGNFTV